MSWLNILIVSPLWGTLSAQFFIQVCLSLIMFVFALVGLIKGMVPRGNNLAAMAASFSGIVVFTLLFFVGLWIVDYLQLAPSGAATIVYWVFVAFSAAYIFKQLPAKLKNGWRDATQEDAMLRRAFENAKSFQSSKRPPEQMR